MPFEQPISSTAQCQAPARHVPRTSASPIGQQAEESGVSDGVKLSRALPDDRHLGSAGTLKILDHPRALEAHGQFSGTTDVADPVRE